MCFLKNKLCLFSRHATSSDNALIDKENISNTKNDSKTSHNEEPSVW